jgi:uracil-DNA glycosylase family 4
VLCRPPPKENGRDNRPTARAIKACRERLIHEIKTRKAEAVLALGGPAARTLLDSNKGIREMRREGCQHSPFFESPVVATFHPAAREPDKLAVMISDVGRLVTCSVPRR